MRPAPSALAEHLPHSIVPLRPVGGLGERLPGFLHLPFRPKLHPSLTFITVLL